MSSIDLARRSCVAIEAHPLADASVSSARVRNCVRSIVVVLGAASLAACAQSSSVRQASWHHERTAASSPPTRHVATVRKHTPFVHPHNASSTEIASHGVASFYTEGTQTASGEKFNTHDLTAAHPTLPFGTRLRVTNVTSGKSVTVRINDRGPYVAGRVVDVSFSAANALGMVDSGIAKVKLDVVH
jgi:rare lipoprotein A